MAYLPAPDIDWGGAAPQAQAVLVAQNLVPTVSPLVNATIPAPDFEDLGNTTYGHSI